MGTMNRRCALVLATLAIATATGPASAQEETARTSSAAQALFDEAKTLVTQQRWAEACPKLAQSQQLEPRPTTLFRLGECYEHIGKTASARNAYLSAASGAAATGQTKRADFARERAKALEPSVPLLVISVYQKDATVFRDGERVDNAAWGTKVPVDPGDHVVSAESPGRQSFVANVSVQPATTTVITVPPMPPMPPAGVALEGGSPSPPASATPGAAPAEKVEKTPKPTADNPGLRKLGIIMGGVGVAALGSGVGVYFATKDEQSGQCVATCAGLGTGLIVAGAISAAAGLVFFLASFGDSNQARVSQQTTPARPFELRF